MNKQSQPYNELYDRVRAKGLRLGLATSYGQFVNLSVFEGSKRVRSVSMSHPRPLTLDQASTELLRVMV